MAAYGARTLATIAFGLACLSAAAAISVSVCWRRKGKLLASRIHELEGQLKASLEKVAAERRGRIRAQQDLRKALTQRSDGGSEPVVKASISSFYPMTPIATVQSCFSTKNGTPRQPLLVPLARACLVLDSSRVPPSAVEGLSEYSHCWILYVFHLNTDLEKLWKDPARSKFKAKVRVPRLEGGKMGALATRTPHRPCPIGLTVAKVEAVDGHIILLSGVDLVDGTPVLDIKPYLPYSDCIQEARIPEWIVENNSLAVTSVDFSEEFSLSLSSCWDIAGNFSLYASHDELRTLIKQVLSWDIRSLSQKMRPRSTPSVGNITYSRSQVDMLDESHQHFVTSVGTSLSSPNEVMLQMVVLEIRNVAPHGDRCSTTECKRFMQMLFCSSRLGTPLESSQVENKDNAVNDQLFSNLSHILMFYPFSPDVLLRAIGKIVKQLVTCAAARISWSSFSSFELKGNRSTLKNFELSCKCLAI